MPKVPGTFGPEKCPVPSSTYQLSDFNFNLPEHLIAAFPPQDRPSAKLMHVDLSTGARTHYIFRDILKFLKSGDVLVLNNTKVRRARIFGRKDSGGKVEALLLKEIAVNQWRVLLRPGGRLKKGMWITFAEGEVELPAEILDDATPDSGEREIRFFGNDVATKLEKIGHIPLPPYLDRPDTDLDREMYQTVFAQREGAVASPTAGLHFDNALLAEIRTLGVEIVFVTLHVGYGTFQPVTAENLTDHKMFYEDYELTSEAAEQINLALVQKRRVIACGTTSVRVLESAVMEVDKLSDKISNRSSTFVVQPGSGRTNLFVYPPYDFKIISGLITNFHLPKSSLLLLVSAFLGKEKMDAAYQEAIHSHYRFYSYGDAMLIL